MLTLGQWAHKWQIPSQALQELLYMNIPNSDFGDTSEQITQKLIRLESSKINANMFRNNSGVLPNANGVPVRYGLANDSKKLNKYYKSSDLIGITPIIITQQLVGKVLGIFTAIEVKKGNWKYSNNEREEAQWRFINLIKSKGGFAGFARTIQDYYQCLRVPD